MDQPLQLLSPIIFISFFSYFATKILIPISDKIGLVDRQNSNNIHAHNIPVIGGIVMYISIVASAAIFLHLPEQFLSVCLITGLVILLGIVDDKYSIPPLFKLLFQLLTALAIASIADISVLYLGSWGDTYIKLNLLSVPFTVLGIVAFCNAYNMLDGIDGLTASIALIAIFGLIILTYGKISSNELLLFALFAFALIIFLTFNLKAVTNKNKIFMGDAGSMFLGVSIAIASVYYSQQSELNFRPVTALWLSALPIFDMVRLMINRKINGEKIMQRDLSHIHHILIRLGFSKRQCLWFLIVLASLLATIGIAMNYLLPQNLDFVSLIVYLIFLLVYVYSLQYRLKNISQ